MIIMTHLAFVTLESLLKHKMASAKMVEPGHLMVMLVSGDGSGDDDGDGDGEDYDHKVKNDVMTLGLAEIVKVFQ